MSDIEVVPHKDIHEAIAAAMHDCGYVQKTTAPGLKYKIAGEQAMLEEARPAFIRHGIYAYVSGYPRLDVEDHVQEKSYNGVPTKQYTTSARAIVEVTFAHGASGTSIVAYELGEGMDYGDKALGKVTTYAFKGAIRRTLMLVTGDDPDETPSDDFSRSPEPEPQRRQQQSRPAAASRPAPKAEGAPEPRAGNLAGVAERLGATPVKGVPVDTWAGAQAYAIASSGHEPETEGSKAFKARWLAALGAEFKRSNLVPSPPPPWGQLYAIALESIGIEGVAQAVDQAIKDAKGGQHAES